MNSPHAPSRVSGTARQKLFNTQCFNLSLTLWLNRTLWVIFTAVWMAIAIMGGSHRGMAQVADPAGEDAFETMASTARFLTQTTFGPKPDEVMALTGSSPSQWFLSEFNKAPGLNTPLIEAYITDFPRPDEDGNSFIASLSPRLTFWVNAISASDQLRQRMAFALSQIVVVSNGSSNNLRNQPLAMGYYQDVLTQNAFGNYRDLLEDVTYSPAMAFYLTYMTNRKGDPKTGRVPDENYARELMQLFTIGLVELNLDGTPKTDSDGDPIETYTNADVTGLARVFTGLSTHCGEFGNHHNCREHEEDLSRSESLSRPLNAYPQFHSELEKSFLGTTIPAGTGPVESIALALDTLFNHPNMAPFVSLRLIQRFVTSNPSPEYLERVAAVFESGSYTLPDGSLVGEARRGDLQATLAAILFDDDARSLLYETSDTFGKIREPVIRFTNWARAFNVSTVTPEYMPSLWYTSSSDQLGQQPYGAPSVFNFYRPGYVSPGSLTAAAGLTAPELQIVNAATIPGYVNFMNAFISEAVQDRAVQRIENILENLEIPFEPEVVRASFRPNYDFEFDLVRDAEALVDRVEAVMTYVTLSQESKAGIIDAINAIPIDPFDQEFAAQRVHLAILMVMTSPDYLVQR